jgi:LacI family transcriptional regulator
VYPRVVGGALVDGLIVTATRMGDPLVDRLADERLPFVVVGRPEHDVSYVDVDNAGGARMAAHHLCELGYRRIAYLGAPTNTTAGRDRLEGFCAGLADRGRTLDPELRVDGDFTEMGGYRAMQRLLPSRPDAVFAASDTMALGAMRALAEAGLDVPGDVAIVGFDGMPASEHTAPPLTTVRQPVAETGRRAAELLMKVIGGEATPPATEILPVELVVRESSRDEKTDAQRVGSNA